MKSNLSLRMFVAGIILKTEDSCMYFNDLYDQFVTDFFQNIRCFYSPRMMFTAVIDNEDQWFTLIPFRPLQPGEVDDYCHISINKDVQKLEEIRNIFLCSQEKTRTTAPPSLREFIDNTINILNEKVARLHQTPAQVPVPPPVQLTAHYDYKP